MFKNADKPRVAGAIAAGVVAVMAVALFTFPSQAQVLYKWTDAEGHTQYSDQPPKNFKGEVTRLEPPDAAATATPSPPAPAKARAPEAERAAKPAPPDLLTQRRATRDALDQRLTLARAKLDSARSKLDAATIPSPDSSQVIQQVQGAPGPTGLAPGGMFGLTQQRSNCRSIAGPDGKAATICGAIVPNEGQAIRIASLEEAVKRAEDEVHDAEQAYRRGVD